jgi:predicted ester cyclase
MSTDANKAVVRAFYAALERGDFAALGQYCHKDFIFYSQVDTPKPGIEGFIASEKSFFDECVDWKMPIHHLVAEGDKVAAYLVFEGTYAPTGKHLRFSLLFLLTFENGKIIEKRAHFDPLEIGQQMGVQP